MALRGVSRGFGHNLGPKEEIVVISEGGSGSEFLFIIYKNYDEKISEINNIYFRDRESSEKLNVQELSL